MFLKSIEVSNFRSIRGRIAVPLDSPIVLVHGLNGAGKTSLLSAIELALTGDIAAIRRIDDDYRKHLIHRGESKSNIEICCDGLAAHHVTLSESSHHVSPALPIDKSRFFTERCYLAQALLGRLLEIYQDDGKNKESPLTSFVKDLLGLDQLDRLIEGLRPVVDIRNFRRCSPEFANLELRKEELTAKILSLEESRKGHLDLAKHHTSRIYASAAPLLPDGDGLQEIPYSELHDIIVRNDVSDAIFKLSTYRNDLNFIRYKLEAASPNSESVEANISRFEREIGELENRLSDWRSAAGNSLSLIYERVKELIQDYHAPSANNPAGEFQYAHQRIGGLISTITASLKADDEAYLAISGLDAKIQECTAIISSCDDEIGRISINIDQLGAALSSIAPHAHDDNCPVCGRDFSEISEIPLSHYIAERISQISEQASTLQNLARTRAMASDEVRTLSNLRSGIISNRLSSDLRLSFETQRIALEECLAELQPLREAAELGARLFQDLHERRQRLTQARTTIVEIDELKSAAEAIIEGLEAFSPSPLDTTLSVISQAESHVISEIGRLDELRKLRNDIIGLFQLVSDSHSQAESTSKAIESTLSDLSEVDSKILAASDHRKLLRQLLDASELARKEVIGTVFNSTLNRVWRDLFVRLAPGEPFVPSFQLPKPGATKFSAHLETVHRLGGAGGAPGAMLSAGNLNTAALTLFLALNLSVDPALPCLVLDDPVQSMDEIHISQFAALLRTISKSHSRQVIVAVHEKALFDYLSLELSPAFMGDRLVTVQLSRSSHGETVAECFQHEWKDDNAFAA